MASDQASIQTYFAPLVGSGRTAPNLLQDIVLYDPHLRSQPGRNLLADGPINFSSNPFLYLFLPEGSCKHEFYLQPRQSKVPQVDERPSYESKYWVAAICIKCRIHINLKVDYTATMRDRPCPNEEHPVHHLIRSVYRENLARSELPHNPYEASVEQFVYECSSSSCAAVVSVSLSPELLSEATIHTLTDAELLKQRTDEAFAVKAGDTEGMRRPSATDVLTDLRTYLRNTWKTESKSEISVENKRFAVRFGPAGTRCAHVLESLSFTLSPGVAWQVPKPIFEDKEPFEHTFNKFLDNVEYELSALILGRPESERHASQDTTALYAANVYFARILGCQDYERSRESRAVPLDPSSRPMAYTVLGVPADASDNIVSLSYDWQCAHHPSSSPHYLSALESVAMERGDDLLITKCAIEQSNGRVTYDQLLDAHKALGLSIINEPNEDHIIGTFESRVQDARGQETQLRESLRVIGVGLNSSKIVDHAAKEISSYEQALTYLGVTQETSDEFVQSMYTLKVTEHASQQEMAAKAVQVISRHRRSQGLQKWIDSGFSTDIETQMDIGEAYQTLEISDRTMDDDTILAVYSMRKTEVADPQRFTRALTAIAQSRNSALLLSELQISAPEISKAALTEPVGLDNIGNTCYLNSLLQFLFTIRKVREIVLHFDQYRMDASPENMLVKKVGQRKISVKEVETAQKFAISLAGLFASMITASKTTIRPEQELARLTLETNQVKEKIRRRSTLGATTRPSLGMIENRQIQGPLLPTEQMNVITDETPLLSPDTMSPTEAQMDPIDRHFFQQTQQDVTMQTEDDNSSEATLVSNPNSGTNTPLELITSEQQQSIFDNKENLAPSKGSAMNDVSIESGEPLRPASPSKINAQAGALSNRLEVPSIEDQPIQYQPPPGPPPVPPRRPAENATITLEEYARQQDVTEVVGHCLFQLSCAMRPTGFDQSGEQQDEIHDLFFGECRGHTVPEKATPDSPLPFLNVQAAVINQPKDVYAALDNYFDLSDAGNGRRGYISITKLPPILTITLGRVVWDSQTNSQKKLDHHVDIPQTLYMDRYLESSPESALAHERQQSWKLKEELAELENRRFILEQQHAESADVPGLFDDARRCLEYLEKEVSPDPRFGGSVEFDPTLKNYLGQIAEQKRVQLEKSKSSTVNQTENLNNLFRDLKSHPYKLHAAFFHRGSHGSGHYWVYIIDHKTGIWRKYNDDHVTIVNNLAEIFDKPDTTGGWSGPANPYFLVYVKDDDSAHEMLVETIKREPVMISQEHENKEGMEDGIDLVPLGSDPWPPHGVTEMPSGKARSQMAELPPNSTSSWDDDERPAQGYTDIDQWMSSGVDNDTPGVKFDNNGGTKKEGHEENWYHVDTPRNVQW